MKKAILSVLLKVLLACLGFFVVTFTIYFFNLDMKATSLLAPLLEKWYDRKLRFHVRKNQQQRMKGRHLPPEQMEAAHRPSHRGLRLMERA